MTEQMGNDLQPPPLAPHLCVDGAADAIDFYTRAFGATEMMRMPGPDGRLIHAAILVNGALVMLHDEYPDMGALGPKKRGGTAVTLHLNVPDADAAAERAVAAGATVVMPVGDQFWGDRYGVLEDPFGHHWSVAHKLRDVSVEEMQAGTGL
ncbi:VOC family protein [Sandaracinobacter sp. RS1-74]|uniref:VOC family protein n=1 Tax=Sandaracinobacteroides sayramensis TaxID=2913411 RepID=UPI001ED9C860|nr:VOC family protein [Sandaracinobacteroides sayramensis]MCG2842495.1 VOC family protein [Sandaracinobacteroides sayramensis]